MTSVKQAFETLRDLKSPGFAHVTPIVNLNGTSKSALLESYVAIKDALDAAEKAFREATPHGRDYQMADRDLGSVAREAFHERRALLRAMAAEIEAVAIAILDQAGNHASWPSRAETTPSLLDKLRAALKPFADVADMEERAADGDSVMVNVSRCRDARRLLNEGGE